MVHYPMDNQTSEHPDLYAECLKAILQFYDVQIDFKGLMDNMPKSADVLGREDIALVGKKLDFTCKEMRLPFGKLGKLSAPAILVLKEGPCLYYPDKGNRARFVFPGREDGEMSLDQIKKSYDGVAILFFPRETQTSLDLDNMKVGHVIDWFWQPIMSFWGKYAEVILCSLFINLLALAVPLFTMNVYDRVVINFAQETLVVLTIGVVIALCFDMFFKIMRSYILERIASRISVRHDYDLMERLMHIKDVDIGLSVGEKTNLFRELQGLREFYAARLVPTMVDIPFFILFVLVIYVISPALAIIPVVAAAVIFIINMAAQMPVNRTTEEHFTVMQSKSTALVELLGGITTTKILNAAGYKLMQWNITSENASEAAFNNNFIGASVANLTYLAGQIAYVCVIFMGVYQIQDGGLTVGGLIACTIIYSRAIGPVSNFSSVIIKLKQSRDVLETIDKIFQLPHEDIKSRRKGSKGPFKGKILIEDLSYQYPGQTRVALYKNNLQIEPGEHIAIIGQTGAGKTTLSKIVAGLISPQEGNIFLDGYVYSAIAESELHRSVGYVPQDPFFFNGTIRENILMGQHMASDDALLNQVVQFSGLDLVMQQTGEGLDMDVGEQGKKLSGGQKQAISLARAMIRNPQLLVFDEPTTGMDNALEARVKASLTEFIKNKTFIMVTHRTSLLPLVDRIILMDRGKIVADGPRDEIIQKLSGS